MNTSIKPVLTDATPGPWRYEASTKTIRSEPANYWLATMDSWDGAVNHEANAKLIAAAPELLEALTLANDTLNYLGDVLNGMDASQPEDVLRCSETFTKMRAALAKARGE